MTTENSIDIFSAKYFIRMVEILKQNPDIGTNVTMQVFQRKNAILCGMKDAINILQFHAPNVELYALEDGDEIQPWEPVLLIKGNLRDFGKLESIYLGILARQTKVATNTNAVVKAANGKPVLFFADRFDFCANQYMDGYAASIGGASDVATDAQAMSMDKKGVGTMPHALIAAFGGNVVAAALAFHKTFPEEKVIALVDFNNDCVLDSLLCLDLLGDDLYGVRLDTSGNMVDRSLALEFENQQKAHNLHVIDPIEYYGVNKHLVRKVRKELDVAGGEHVKIVVSGGFNPERIDKFEQEKVPVDIYAVGSSLLQGSFDFTADIVEPCAKVGRKLQNTSRLKKVQ